MRQVPARWAGVAAAIAVAAALAGCGSGGAPARSASALVPIGAGLHGPSGTKATIFATGLKHVSAFALDARGRLWATTSAASGHADDGVSLVPRAGARAVKVIKNISGPLGLVWHGGALYVTTLGRVERFTGLHGTQFAHRTTILTEPAGHGWDLSLIHI